MRSQLSCCHTIPLLPYCCRALSLTFYLQIMGRPMGIEPATFSRTTCEYPAATDEGRHHTPSALFCGFGIQLEGLQGPRAVPQRASLPAARLGEATNHGLHRLLIEEHLVIFSIQKVREPHAEDVRQGHRLAYGGVWSPTRPCPRYLLFGEVSRTHAGHFHVSVGLSRPLVLMTQKRCSSFPAMPQLSCGGSTDTPSQTPSSNHSSGGKPMVFAIALIHPGSLGGLWAKGSVCARLVGRCGFTPAPPRTSCPRRGSRPRRSPPPSSLR
jgi:hypothetical protein